MTVFEAVEVLREFRQLTLGPELSEAIDVIGRHFEALERVVASGRGDAR